MKIEAVRKRRAEVIERHKTLESVPGSGWHKDDPDMAAAARKGQSLISARPVAIYHDADFCFCDECVPVIREAARKYADKVNATIEYDDKAAEEAGVEPTPVVPIVKQSLAIAEKVASDTGDVIELKSHEFNALMWGMAEMKIQVVTSGVLG